MLCWYLWYNNDGFERKMKGEQKMGIFDVLVAIILGIVEGITEWLPISSTGHMILVNHFLTFSNDDFYPDVFGGCPAWRNYGGRFVILEKDFSF